MKAYKHILVPTDGTTLSLKAAREAGALAKGLGAKVTAVSVTAPWTPPMMDESAVLADFSYSEQAYAQSQAKRAGSALAKVERTLAADKVKCEKLQVNGPQAWE